MNSRIALYASLALLMVVAIIELSFISAMVGWLHATASGTFKFAFDGSTYDLKGEPKNFIVDQGHTSNGAAGTAFILIGIGGFLILWLSSRPNPGKITIAFYHAWLVTNVLSLLLVLSALIYTFVVTNNHKGQTIDPSVAASLDGKKYDIDSWTPQNWFSAFLKLDLVDSSERSDINSHLRIMRGWQYNLIPFFIIHLLETSVALWDASQRRKMSAVSNMQQKGDA
ncbi:hypothetical protein BKA56DRAFT_489560 [Ilyonectria sp. MPI-CAGE-AT-0026]|nr:hypothetical protein BKA56DRAFT_489560 [Ilyonectria sp. MPI-CAGE-AT-0026]